jgi:hypothetical protein
MVYTEIKQPIPAMTEVVIRITAELLSVLALATTQMKQGKLSMRLPSVIALDLTIAEKYVKKLLGENDIESVFHRLDRLTTEESKMTAAQTLGIVCGLVNKMEVVMEGAQRLLT